MTDSPEANPNRATTPQERYTLPERAITGDAFVEKLVQLVDEYCSKQRIDPSVVSRVREYAEVWAETIVAGAPVLAFRENNNDSLVLDEGGVALGPVYLIDDDPGYWEMRVDYVRVDHDGELRGDAITLSPSGLAWDYREPSAGPMIVGGEDMVRAYMAIFGRGMQREDLTPDDVLGVAELLRELQRATLPIDYLSLDDAERAEICNGLLEAVLTDGNAYRQVQAFEACLYLADITGDEQLRALIDSLEDQWTELLPLAPGDDENGVINATEGFARRHPPSELLPASEQVAPEPEVLHASFLADLYARRAELEHARQQPEDEPQLTALILTEPPEPRELSVFTKAHPNSNDVRQDIAYIRGLRAVGYPVTLAIKRDHERMYKGIAHLCDFAHAANDPADRLEAFDAMEYMFNLQSELQRDEFYVLMGERFALSVPMESQAPLHRHVAIAEAMGRMMPQPPTAEEGVPLVGRARTAAVMSHIYRRKALQLLRKQMRRYTPVAEDEEDSANAEEVV